jgi:23S rRNA (uracil1939-C5)-methyltransferase
VIVRVEKVVYPGRRLARHENKVVFTDSGLPGETVEVEVVRERGSFTEARTVGVVEPSPSRVEPRCGHYLACSSYQEMDYRLQLELKRAQLEEMILRELKRPPEPVKVVPSPETWGYRNRISLKLVSPGGGRPFFAYNEPGEQASFTAVEACALVPDVLNELAAECLAAAVGRDWRSLRGLELRLSRTAGKALVVLKVAARAELEDMARVFSGSGFKGRVSGAVALVERGRSASEAALAGEAYLEERVGGALLRYGARSFFQVNTGILEQVIADMRALVEPLGGAFVADLYCGIGTFGLALAGAAEEAVGVESEQTAVAFMRKNIALNNAHNFTALAGRSEKKLPGLLARRPDVVILDPPRRGVAPEMTEALRRMPVPLLLYLSCNPATLARDLKALLTAYELRSLTMYDFFPQTPHIESLAVLEGTGGRSS